MTLGTLFDQLWICLPQWCPIPNINAVRPVGSWGEDFWRLIKIFLIFFLIEPQKVPTPLFEPKMNPHPQACFHPSLVEIGPVVLEKSFKGKTWRRTDGRRTLRHDISSHGLHEINFMYLLRCLPCFRVTCT